MSQPPAITLRPATEADIPLLFRIYAGTRETELAMFPWTPEQKHEFLVMQFHCQHSDYHQNYADAAFDVVESAGQPVGRLYLHRRAESHHIIDIAILPEHRGAGIGTQLLTDVIAEADRAGKCVAIHVEKHNPALRLYRRLGFVEQGDSDFHFLMEHPPQTPAQTQTS